MNVRKGRRDPRHSRETKLAQVTRIEIVFCRKGRGVGRGSKGTCGHARDVPSKDKKEFVYGGKLLRGAYVEGNRTGIESSRRIITGGSSIVSHTV